MRSSSFHPLDLVTPAQEPEEERTRRLVRVLCHVFDPLLCSLSDALANGTFVSDTDAPSLTNGSEAENEALSLPHSTATNGSHGKAAQSRRPSLLLTRSTQHRHNSNTIAASSTAATVDGASAETSSASRLLVLGDSQSPPSPLPSTRAFSSACSSPDWSLLAPPPTTVESDDEPNTRAEFSSSRGETSPTRRAHEPRTLSSLVQDAGASPLFVFANDSAFSSVSPVALPHARTRPRLHLSPLVAIAPEERGSSGAPRHPATSSPAAAIDTRMGPEQVLFWLPNAVIWEAVAALAESVLYDGSCFSWLRSGVVFAAMERDETHRRAKEEANGRDALAVGPASTPTARTNVTSDEEKERTSSARALAVSERSSSPSELLTEVLFRFDQYATRELRTYGRRCALSVAESNGKGGGRGTPGREALTKETRHDRVFAALAAVVVRSVALHTAQLLRALRSDGAVRRGLHRPRTSGVPGHNAVHPVQSAADYAPFSLSGFSQPASQHELETATESTSATPEITFDEVQEGLMSRPELLRETAVEPARSTAPALDPTTVARRRALLNRKTDNRIKKASPDDHGILSVGGGPLPPALDAYVTEADMRDASCFLLLCFPGKAAASSPSSHISPRSPSSPSAFAIPKSDARQPQQPRHMSHHGAGQTHSHHHHGNAHHHHLTEQRNGAAPALNSGAPVMSRGTDFAVLALSFVLPEVCPVRTSTSSTSAAAANGSPFAPRSTAQHQPPTATATLPGWSTSSHANGARDRNDTINGSAAASYHQALRDWCQGLQDLAAPSATSSTTEDTAPHDGTAAHTEKDDGSPPVFTISSARLFDYLRHDIMRQETAYALPPESEKRPVLPSLSAAADTVHTTTTTVAVQDGDDSAEGDEDEMLPDVPSVPLVSTALFSRWRSAQWSIRPILPEGGSAAEVAAHEEKSQEAGKEETSETLVTDLGTSGSALEDAVRWHGTKTARDDLSGSFAPTKRPRVDDLLDSAYDDGILPMVEWLNVSSGDPAAVDSTSELSVLGMPVEYEMATLFQNVLPAPEEGSSDAAAAAQYRREVLEPLGEVGSVLSCVDAVCSGRTMLDTTGWRYGRNRMNAAAVSFVTTDVVDRRCCDVLRSTNDPDASNNSGSGRAEGSAGSGFRALALPALASSVKTSRGHTLSLNVVGGRPRNQPPVSAERTISLGLYHHETGLLYVADGSTYAMERE